MIMPSWAPGSPQPRDPVWLSGIACWALRRRMIMRIGPGMPGPGGRAGGAPGPGAGSLGDRVDLIGYEPVRLAVHAFGGVGVRGIDQAEDLAVLLIHPVAQVMNAVCALGLQVGGVRLRHVVDGDRAAKGVGVHEQCHRLYLSALLRAGLL